MLMDSLTSYYGDTCTGLPAFHPASAVEAAEAAIVRAIVRGEQPIEALEVTSIRITAYRIHKTGRHTGGTFLTLSAADLAEGILNQMHNPSALAEWASFILVAGELFTFEDRKAEACDRLLSAVWNVAFGGHINQTAVRLAQSLRYRFASA